MSLLTRIKNMWELSKYTPLKLNEKLETGDIIAPLIKKGEFKPAKIISLEPDPIEQFDEVQTP